MGLKARKALKKTVKKASSHFALSDSKTASADFLVCLFIIINNLCLIFLLCKKKKKKKLVCNFKLFGMVHINEALGRRSIA